MENSSSKAFFKKPNSFILSLWKQSWPPNQFRGTSFPLRASPELEHKLNQVHMEISLGFPLDSYLGEPKNPNAGNSIQSIKEV